MVPDSVLKSVVTAASYWGYVDPDQKSTLFRTVWADSHGRSVQGRAMSRKRRSSKKTGTPVLHSLNPNAAGVDIGATEIYIAVPADRDAQPVRHFSTFTEDLHAAADWLKSCNIETVAMESTGVYWIPFFQILEARGASLSGQRTPRKECAGAQVRRFRLSMASVPEFSGAAAGVVAAGTV